MKKRQMWLTAGFGALAALAPAGRASADTGVAEANSVNAPQTSQIILDSDGDSLTVSAGGAINYSSGGLAPPYAVIAGQTTGHTAIDNSGNIVDTFNVASPTTTNVSAIRFAALAGTSITINNSGQISAAHLMAYSANQSAGRTGSTDFTNSGDIESFTSGGVVSVPVPGGVYNNNVAMLFGRGDDTFTNSGTVNGDVFMGLGNDTVNIHTGSQVSGTIFSDDGSITLGPNDITPAQFDAEGGTINFIGSINTKTSQQTIGSTSGPDYAVDGFKNVHFQSGYWTLAGDVQGALFTIDAGATVELHDSDARFNEFVYGVFNDLGTALVNNGHMIFYNDLTTISTDDGININTSGSGSLDLYNTNAADGVFLFAATGGFGGGLNLHGGTVILTSNYTGNINVLDGGTLRIGGNLVDDPNPLADPSNVILAPGGGTTGNVLGNLHIDGTLIFDRSNDITFAGNLSGNGLIIKNGTGTTTLSGNFSYTGGMQINGGTVNLTGNIINTGTTDIAHSNLYVNGSITSNVGVGSGGSLCGSGAINGDVTIGAGGTSCPGNSPGTQSVAGNFTFGTGSTYQIQTLPNGVSDKIVVTGGAMTILSGAVADIQPGGTTYSLHTNYTIATATGGVFGTFGTVTSNLAFLDPTLTYSANAITLTLTRNDVAFTDLAETPNQAGVAGAVEQLNGADPVFLAALNLGAGSAPGAFDALSGEAHGSFQSANLTGTLGLLGQVQDRLMQLSEAPALVQLASLSSDAPLSSARRGSRLWAEAFGVKGDVSGASGSADLDFDRSGLTFGWDATLGQDSMLGAALSFGRANADVHALRSSAHDDFYDLAIYGGTHAGDFILRGAVGYSQRSNETARNVVVGMLNQHLTASYDSRATSIETEIARPFQAGAASIEPFLNLAHVSLDSDGFTETGGSAALTAADASVDVTFSTLGVRVGRNFGAANAPVILFGSLGWRHAGGDIIPRTDMAFASHPGVDFSVAGAPIAKDSAAIEAGLNMSLSAGLNLSASYRGDISSNASEHGVRARLSWQF